MNSLFSLSSLTKSEHGFSTYESKILHLNFMSLLHGNLHDLPSTNHCQRSQNHTFKMETKVKLVVDEDFLMRFIFIPKAHSSQINLDSYDQVSLVAHANILGLGLGTYY